MALPHKNIKKIPNTDPAAVPALWNDTYEEIDENFKYLEEQINSGVALGNTAGSALAGVASAGSATTAARSDHVHPLPTLYSIQSTTNVSNANATSLIAASQSSSTITDGAGTSAIIASGACTIDAPSSGQSTTVFNSAISSTNSKTSGTSRHCSIIGSQGVDVQNKTTGGIYYGYVANETTASPSNIQFSVTQGGKVTGSNIATANTADYAEFFENETLAVIPLGTLVTLNGDRVRIADVDDDVIGVITAGYVDVLGSDGKKQFSGTPAVIGADTPYTWAKRYLTGDHGQILYQMVNGNPEPVENPDYDPTQTNIPRSERPEEWSCVGLLGQVYVNIDNSVSAGNWISPSNGFGTRSNTKTNLRCMKVTKPFNAESGYGVALCLLK